MNLKTSYYVPQKPLVVGEPGMIRYVLLFKYSCCCFNFSNMIFIPRMFQSKGILQVKTLFGIKLSCYYKAHITNPIGKNIKIIGFYYNYFFYISLFNLL